MDVSAEQTESCHGERPYSPSDIMTYDISSDESDIKARIEFGPVVETSSSSSDSSDDSLSSYEYHWEEAKPAKPPFEPFITSVSIGSTDLLAIKREYTTVVPLKLIFGRLLPNRSSVASEVASRLGVHWLTKYEADLLTDHVNGWKKSVLGDGDSTEFNRGDVACSYKSLKREYVGLLEGVVIGRNDKVEKSDRSCDRIKRNNLATCASSPSNSTFASYLVTSDDDCKNSKEKRSSRNSSMRSSKTCSVADNSPKKIVKRAVGDRIADAITEEVDKELRLNRALPQRAIYENKTGDSPALKDHAHSCSTRNGVVLRHLYPENEGEDFDSEISRVLSIVRRKQNPRKIRGEPTKDIPSLIVENSEMKEHLSEHSASNPFLPYVKATQDLQTADERDCETDGEDDEKLELLHVKNAEDLIPTTKTNWKALDNTSDNLRVPQDAHPSDHEERIAYTSTAKVGGPAIRIFWNTPKIASKSIGVSLFSDYDSGTTNTEAEAAAASEPISTETSYNTSHSQSPPTTSSIANQPGDVAMTNQTRSESNDSVRLESEWAVTDSYICKSPDQYLTSSSETERAIRCRYATRNCDNRKQNNLTHKPNSTERRNDSSITNTNECNNMDSKPEKKHRKDMCQHSDNAEVLSSPSNSSSGRRTKGTFSPTVSTMVEDKPLSSSVAKIDKKEHRPSNRSRVYRNTYRRPDSADRDGEASNRRSAAKSKITKSSLRKRNTHARSRSSTSEKSVMDENSSSKDNDDVLSSVEVPKFSSTMFKEEKRISESNRVISYQYATNYSKLRYTYDSTMYSPISSDDADFGFSDSCDEVTSRTKTRKVLRRRSVRDSLRTSHERSEERRKSFRDEMPELQSHQGVVRYPITRVDDSKEDDSCMTVIPNLLLYNPNSRLKANVENLVVSIRSQCDRDVSVVENRSKLSSRHVVVRRLPDRRRSSRQWIRRRSHSPSCLRSVSPVSFRRQGSKRRRSLSPVRTRHSRERGSLENDAPGITAKLIRRHKRDSAHPLFFNLTNNGRFNDEVGNRLAGTHGSEMRYSSSQSSKINCGQENALSSVDGESVFQDKYNELYSTERSAFSDIKSALNESGNKLVRRREVRDRLDSTGLSPMAYELLSSNGTNVDDDEIVIFKKRNPLEECWPFFFHKSDDGMSSEDENCVEEGCFMIGKLIASLRNSKITAGIKKLERAKRDNIINEEPSHANAPSVESTLINLREAADQNKAANHKPSCDAVKYQLCCDVPAQSHAEERNKEELPNNDTSNAGNATFSILDDKPSELAVSCPVNAPAKSDGATEEEHCHAEFCDVLNTDATDHTIDELVPVDVTSAVQCEGEIIGENLAIALPLQNGCNTKETVETSRDSPAAENFQAVVRRQISPAIEVTTAVSSPCAYEEVAIAGDCTVDKANAGLVGASALQANLIQCDSLNAIVSIDETSAKFSSVRQQTAEETSSPRSVEVESPNIFDVDQDGMCLGATITVEDDKCSRTTNQNISNEPSSAKSWKKKLIEKAQNSLKPHEKGNVETSLNPNRNAATLSGSVNIEKAPGTSAPPDQSWSSNIMLNRSSVLKGGCPDSRGSNEKHVAVDKRQKLPTENDLTQEVNHSHGIESNRAKNGRELSAESSRPVSDHSIAEGFPAIISEKEDSAAEPADVAGECNSVNIPTVVDDSTLLHTTVCASSPVSTSKLNPQGDDGMSAASVGQNDGPESKDIPDIVTISPSKDVSVSTRSPTSERLLQEDAKSETVTESVINQSRSQENAARMSSLSENAVISRNIPSTSERIHQPNEEKTSVSTDVVNELQAEMIISEAPASSPKDTIKSGSSTSSNSVEEAEEDNRTLLACAKLTDDSMSGDIVLGGSPRSAQEDKTSPTTRGVPNAFKSIVVDSKTGSLLSEHAPSHSTQISSPAQIPPECNERLSSSAGMTSKLIQQNTVKFANLSSTNSTTSDCFPLSSSNGMPKKHNESGCVSLGEAKQIPEIITSSANSLNDLCDSTSVVQTTISFKDSCHSTTADMGHDGQKPLRDSTLNAVPATKVTDKETVPRVNFSVSGASGSLQSSSSANASCLSSSRIFAGPASSITIVNRPPVPVGLSNKSAFRGPSVELKSKQPKTILAKPWESSTKIQTANAPSSLSLHDARSKRRVAASQRQNMMEDGCSSHSEKGSKPLKSILLNRNDNSVFSNNTKSIINSPQNPKEVISISNSKTSNEVTYADNPEIYDVVPGTDIVNFRKYAPECSKKRKAADENMNENGSKTKKSKGKRSVAKKSRAPPSCANEKVLAMLAEKEIEDGEFAEGDEVIGSLLPLIKTKAKPKAKKKGSSGRGRGRAKRRGRLPSISSDEDIIEELSAAGQQPSSENKSNAPTENDLSKAEDDEDSDDGLVSFMGIIRSSDAVLPIIPDIKQEAESDHDEDEANIITDSDSNDSETTENATVQDPPVEFENPSEPDNDGVENIFAKFSREMEEMNESQLLCEDSVALSTFQGQDPTSIQSKFENRISNVPSLSKLSNDDGAVDDEAINGERVSGESSHRNVEASESQLHNSKPTPLTLDNISPNILTPPSSPKSDDNSKQATAHCSNSKTSKVQQDGKSLGDFPTHSAKETETTLLEGSKNNTIATTICTATSNTTETNQLKSEGIATDATNLIAAAAEMAGVPTSIRIGSPNTTQHIVANHSSTLIRDKKDDSLTSFNRKTSKAGIATKPLTNTIMPAGKSCHGFLEICLFGFNYPNKFTYALRRIPYVRTTPYAIKNQDIGGEENSSELSSGASTTVATYLRVRDVICLLKTDVGRLHSLITRCVVQLFRPNDYTKDLFATVYDPVGKSDPIIAKMTWRHASEDKVQEFLDHMIVLDKFLHSILPRFYGETLNIRTSDVPNFVNVKIFKPIFEINEEVVKIFRKPYEYNSVLIKKDCSLQSTCVNKRKFSDATQCTDRSRRSRATKSKEVGRLPEQQNRKATTWSENATQNSFASPHTATSITVPTLSPRFVGNGQSNSRLFASLRYPAFADAQHFQNCQAAETRNRRNRANNCDDRTGMVPTTSVGFNTRLDETACRADMIQLSRMGASESSEYMRRSASMLPLPSGLSVQNTISRFGMPFVPMHENHGRPVVNAGLNASSMPHPHVRLYSNTPRGVGYSLSGCQRLFSGNTIVSKLYSAKNAPEVQRPNVTGSVVQPKSGAIQSGIDVLAEAAATVCANDADEVMPEQKAGRNTRSGHQTRRSPKVTKIARSIVDRDEDNTPKPKKRKYQSTRTTRKSARGVKNKS